MKATAAGIKRSARYEETTEDKLQRMKSWYDNQASSMLQGIRSLKDAVILWEYAEQHGELDEFADTWEAKDRIKALGYDPFP